MNVGEVIRLQAEEHGIIETERFSTVEEYVLHLMHLSDYEMVRKLGSGLEVLDVGCNCGYGTHCISQDCARIVGVDVSPRAIATAMGRYQSNNLSFRQVDGKTLPFEDASFEMVTSFQVLEHIADYDRYFNEIRRVLHPHGLFMLATPNAAIRLKNGQAPWNPFHVHEFKAQELSEFLSGYFPCVRVLGVHAVSEAYEVEYNRCIRERDAERWSGRVSIYQTVRRILPNGIVRFLKAARALATSDTRDEISADTMNRFKVGQFFYREADLDTALNLIGICSNEEDAVCNAAEVCLSKVSL